MGDLIHNLADGITVGVAVSQSLTLGLSTTFAICLHEIPHELGKLLYKYYCVSLPNFAVFI